VIKLVAAIEHLEKVAPVGDPGRDKYAVVGHLLEPGHPVREALGGHEVPRARNP